MIGDFLNCIKYLTIQICIYGQRVSVLRNANFNIILKVKMLKKIK